MFWTMCASRCFHHIKGTNFFVFLASFCTFDFIFLYYDILFPTLTEYNLKWKYRIGVFYDNVKQISSSITGMLSIHAKTPTGR